MEQEKHSHSEEGGASDSDTFDNAYEKGYEDGYTDAEGDTNPSTAEGSVDSLSDMREDAGILVAPDGWENPWDKDNENDSGESDSVEG